MHAFFLQRYVGYMKNQTKAIIEMLICSTLWSIAGIFMKLLPWKGFTIASLRSLIAGLTLIVYIILKKYRFVFSKKTLLAGILTGCVYTCFTCANKLTTAANAIVLQFTSPVFVVVISAIVYGTKIKKRDMITVIFTLIGIALFFFDQLKPGYILGNIISILAGLFMAGMFVAVGNLEGEQRYSAIIIGQMFTFLIGLPSVLTSSPMINSSMLLYIGILGVFQLGISYILYINASKYCPPLACCLLGVLEPLLNPVWVMIFDGEKPGLFALIGGIIVITTVTIWCAGSSKEEENAA